MSLKHYVTMLTALLFIPIASLRAADSTKPNIVFILADDLGYGDVQCLNPQRCKIATPQIDKMASQGMIFTDAHSSSSVCTPTRYSILTGRYNWRTLLQSSVLLGYDKPLIAADRLTVPALLKQHGYTSACIGKWHLGMGLPEGEPSPVITDGPTTRGFDSYFGISASLDMPPYAFIENDRFTEPLTTTKEWLRSGPAAASFEAVDVLPTLTKKAVEFVSTQAKSGKPFFLYLPLASPHTPILPSKDWQGKSSIGKYGDFVMETDWAVGELMTALEKAGVASNTLLIFTSDNGCSKAAGIPDIVVFISDDHSQLDSQAYAWMKQQGDTQTVFGNRLVKGAPATLITPAAAKKKSAGNAGEIPWHSLKAPSATLPPSKFGNFQTLERASG